MPLRLLFIALFLAASAGFAHEGKPAPAVVERALEVKQGGAVIAKWTSKDVAAWKAMPDAHAQGGGKAKQYALVDALPAGAKLVAVVVSTGQRVVVDEKWSEAAAAVGGQAVLWQNRRGLFKLGFVDAKGAPVPNVPELRDVVVLELAPVSSASPASSAGSVGQASLPAP